MGVDAHVTSSSTQTFPFSIGDVLASPRIPVLLGHTKVDDTRGVYPRLVTNEAN